MFKTVLIVLDETCRPVLDYIRINSLFTSTYSEAGLQKASNLIIEKLLVAQRRPGDQGLAVTIDTDPPPFVGRAPTSLS